MDISAVVSSCNSCSGKRKRLTSGDSVNEFENDSVSDSVNESEDNSMDDFEGDSENDLEDDYVDDEEMVGDDSPSTVEKEKDLHNAIAELFIDSGLHPITVKTSYFEKLMQLAKPEIPLSVPLVVKEVLEMYEKGKEKAKKFLKDFEGKVTLSCDWLVLTNDVKGPILHDNFVCLSAHFIDDNWKIQKWILGYTTTELMEAPVEGIYVYSFRNAVQEFEIGNKVSTLLLPNNGEFNEESLGGLRKLIEERADNPINPPVFQLYCCADLFRLMVNDVYNDLEPLTEDLRMLVGWGSCSSYNWNIKLLKLQQAIDMKAEDAFADDEYNLPSDEEWNKIQTFCRLTGCIYKVAKELFEEGYSTSNVYFHLLAELKLMLNQELLNSDNDYFHCKAKKILMRFDKYWNDMFLVLATASVLDPRFKTKYLELYCSKKEDNNEGSKVETVLDYLRTLFGRYAASDILSKPICPSATVNSEEEEDDEGEEDEEDFYTKEEKRQREEEKEREKNKPDAYKGFVLFQEYLQGSSREFQESELDSYLKEPVTEWSKDFKVLEFWKEESQKYPILSRVARDILSIPISRATSYDAYVSNRREPPGFTVSMPAKLANAMICGKSWLRL